MKRTESHARVIDFIPKNYMNGPLLQIVGESFFLLFEAEPLDEFEIGERVYIGKDRNRVGTITKILKYNELTGTARAMLPDVLRAIILDNEKFYVDFYNYAPPVSNRMHSLELLPHVGKHMRDTILAERRKKKFESFEDIKKRTGLKDPVGTIVDRILEEYKNTDRYRLFVGKRKFYTEDTLKKIKR